MELRGGKVGRTKVKHSGLTPDVENSGGPREVGNSGAEFERWETGRSEMYLRAYD